MSVSMNPIGAPESPTSSASRARFPVIEWVLGICGGISAFVGGFILLGGDDATVDLGGIVSWPVSEIDPTWGYGLIIGGVLALLAALTLALRHRT